MCDDDVRPAYDPRPRRCLMCWELFDSAGPANRRCPDCEQWLHRTQPSKLESGFQEDVPHLRRRADRE